MLINTFFATENRLFIFSFCSILTTVVILWLIIKIRIIKLTLNARQLLGALFVRHLRFRLVKNLLRPIY